MTSDTGMHHPTIIHPALMHLDTAYTARGLGPRICAETQAKTHLEKDNVKILTIKYKPRGDEAQLQKQHTNLSAV